jgi:hypothetical protein
MPDPSEPQYTPAGVMIDYVLGADESEVRLEILDRDGAVVRAYESEGPGQTTSEAQGMRAAFQFTRGAPRMSSGAGAHRFIWDMRAETGPMVVPGDYHVRLTVGDWSDTKSVSLLPDPRVVAAGVTQSDLIAQYELALLVGGLQRDGRTVAREVAGIVERLEQDSGLLSGQEAQVVRELDAALNDVEGGSYQQPMLVAQISYLNSMINRADQRPGQDAYDRYHELRSELDGITARLEPIRRQLSH